MGMLPSNRMKLNTFREPSLSQSGPETKRTSKVDDRDTMLELATWAEVRWRSVLMVTVSW